MFKTLTTCLLNHQYNTLPNQFLTSSKAIFQKMTRRDIKSEQSISNILANKCPKLNLYQRLEKFPTAASIKMDS